MTRDVVDLTDVDQADVALLGGKGAGLAALARLDGVPVPPGFCVTTEAFRRVVEPVVADELDRLSRLAADDVVAVQASAAQVRAAVQAVAVPDDLVAAVADHLAPLGESTPCAVRSSATAEDLPTASFAGQHQSYLDVVGTAAVLDHLRRCWASLFTDRAIAYRQRAGVDHRAVRLAVVVQRMVPARAAGVLFTADPLTSNRRVAAVEAVHGLGEALVSGLVTPDVLRVRDDAVVSSTTAGPQPVLTDDQVLRLVRLGRRVEAGLGRPQDVEWCLDGDDFVLVQSRPITTLFPVPEADDDDNHVYLSVGHQQMMTDAMKPLGLSFWQLTTPAPMAEAGGRLFVDVTRRVASPSDRAALLELMARSDPLTTDALQTVLDRDGFIPTEPDAAGPAPLPGQVPVPLVIDPAVVTELIAAGEASVAKARRDIRATSGEALLEFIRTDLQELRRLLFDPRSHQVFMSAIEATWWLNDHLADWLGEQNAADVLAQSAPHNVTSQMGLDLLDVADVIREHPEVVAFLERVEDDDFVAELPRVTGGPQALEALQSWLDRYGMRCVGEIDLTRPRWSERPSTLVPVLLGAVAGFEPGESRRRFEEGEEQARAAEQDLLRRLVALPDGADKAAQAKERIDRVRTFIGYREYPKYGMVSRYFLYKQALLAEADRLVREGVLRERDDVYYLSFAEVEDVVRTRRVDQALVERRRDDFRWYQTLRPPRVLTSEGEALTGRYHREAPPDALVGLPVSAGTVEGRARVVLDLADADLRPGDILVTVCTDPSWTPAFVAVDGLVTEVGGVMTHGAVVAREYGLPAVVGVPDATRLIRDGQRIRLHGTDGYVELL